MKKFDNAEICPRNTVTPEMVVAACEDGREVVCGPTHITFGTKPTRRAFRLTKRQAKRVLRQ